MITTIIFDMDGVLIDSERVLDKLEYDFLKRITNNSWTRTDQLSIHGKTVDDVYQILISSFKIKISKEKLFAYYANLFRKTYQTECKLNPKITKVLSDLSSYNFQVALASSTSHKYIDYVLERFNLNRYFKVIVSSEDVKGKSKPEPDIFLCTAKRLNIKPNRCLVIEDSNNGIKAAKRAGMYCLGYNKNQEEIKFADIKIRSFKNFNIDEIIGRLKNSDTNIEKLTFNGKTFYFQLSKNVNKSDYYSDFLLDEIIKKLKESKTKNLQLLEIGTGRGYMAIMLASKFPQIKKVVSVDIDKHSVVLARKNIWFNNLESRIEIRKGTLFSPIKEHEKFNLIFAALPQLPITKKDLKLFLEKYKSIPPYHLTTSVGGKTGQTLIRKFFNQVSKYLLKNGLAVNVQADFSFSESLKQYIFSSGLDLFAISKKKKLLNETSLTKILEQYLFKKNYFFKTDKKKKKYFNLLCVWAKLKNL